MIAGGVVVVGLLLVVALAAATGFDLGRIPRAAVAAIDSMFPPQAATTQGREIRGLYDIVFIIATAIFLVVEGLIVWTVVRYRRKPGDDELPPQIHGNNLAEIAWTVIPTLIVAFLFFVSWQTLNSVDAVSKTPDVKIRAVGSQFQWTFVYLVEDGETELFSQLLAVGEGGGMVVPVDRDVQMSLDSPDVIHAFYVPQFLFKRDVVPGQTNHFDFRIEPQFAGQTFHGQCAELCGIGHRTMLFEIKALSQADYDAWVKEKIKAAKASPPPPPSGSAGPPAVTLGLVAQNIKFDQATLEAPADKPFAIDFANRDNGVAHDVAIRDASGNILFNGADVTGPGKVVDPVPPLKAGSYTFFCTFHSSMTGTLTVK